MNSIFKPRPILGIIAFLVLFFGGTFHVAAQADEGVRVPCPADKVCISREAALKALADADQVKADAVAIVGYKQAIDDLKELLNKMRIEFAETSGELTAVKQNAVSDRAIIDLLLKSTKKKCLPLSICF
jgi:hypothetical protein